MPITWMRAPESAQGEACIGEGVLRFVSSGAQDGTFAEWLACFDADGDEYVLFPACCYDGNRFRVLKKDYPPMFTPEEAGPEIPVTITDVPRLNEDGSGRIEVTAGDVSVPCVGVFSEKRKEGILLFTVQELGGVNLGLSYEKGKIGVSWPAMRRGGVYRFISMRDESNPGRAFAQGETVEIPYRLLCFPCGSLAEFYRVFFENRKCMGLDCRRPEVLPFSEQFALQCRKFNAMNWMEEAGFYAVGTDRSKYQVWQPGWTGGAMSSYPLMKLGGALEWERGKRTLSFLFSTQRESGFFPGVIDAQGKTYGDGFDTPGTERWHLIRKSADVLYFLFKHFALMEERGESIPGDFRAGAKKTADGFVKLWETYGQFGQLVDVDTGELCAGGSTCAAIAPAALARAFRFFGEPAYLRTARESARAYLCRDLRRGYTTGAPGEILQCPDSESAFGLLESFVVLYETTGEQEWLQAASECAHYCASWVTAYNYRFPKASEFARVGMKTVGSVFANAQNKHSAPAICTLSGDSLVKLWEWTGDPLYRELAEDVILTPGQYLSTEKRPLYDWELSPEEREKGDPVLLEQHRLPEGFMCERVNLSDWEGEACVGGVFNGSCWCETSNLLAIAEAVPRLFGEQGAVLH